MTRSKCHDLVTPTVKERLVRHDKSVNSELDQTGEGVIQALLCARVDQVDIDAEGARGCSRSLRVNLQRWTGRVHEISRRLGHDAPAVTLTVYAHLFEKADTIAASAIDAALTKGSKT